MNVHEARGRHALHHTSRGAHMHGQRVNGRVLRSSIPQRPVVGG